MTRNLQRVVIIAEAGVNHDGDVRKALALIDAAADAGADMVKFQTFIAGAMTSKAAPKAAYQMRTTDEAESQLAMLQRLELPHEAYRDLTKRAAERGIAFLSTPFDANSLALLLDLGLPVIKIGSGDLTNAPLLLDVARAGKKLILSTGMATMDEIEEALGVLAFGYSASEGTPMLAAFAKAWADPDARRRVITNVILLHCTTEYPCPPEEANLRAMASLREAFGVPVGYSDHTEGIVVPIAAVADGAVVIEKHLTLDRTAPGPDHAASIELEEFRAMVDAIRVTELALGDGTKGPQPSELKNRTVARKSLVAARPIRAGEAFNVQNMTVKRPGNGCAPSCYWSLLGTPANRDYDIDELIEP